MRKIAVIGGGGFRTPRLLHGLFRHASDLDLGEVALFDPDSERVAVMKAIGDLLARRHGAAVRVSSAPGLAEAAGGADFVLLTFRPGGEEGRRWDERVAIDQGLLGQETVGPGGFFSALRTIAAMGPVVDAVRAQSPDAWLVNFTNPVGLVSEAMARRGVERFVGVCDTPYHLQQELAGFLGVEPDRLRVESAGLNHMGWILRLWQDGRDRLPEVLDRIGQARSHIRPLSFFTPEEMLDERVLPTEYVYMYLHADEVWQRQRQGPTRGEAVLERSHAFFARAAAMLRTGPVDAVWELYRETLVGRSNSYMQNETRTHVARSLTPDTIFESESYERVAIDTMLGLCGAGRRLATLNTPSLGVFAPALGRAEVGEATCLVDPSGPVPLPLSRAIPAGVDAWMRRVKRYEAATAEAALTGNEDAMVGALALNPIVPSADAARALVAARREHPPFALVGDPIGR